MKGVRLVCENVYRRGARYLARVTKMCEGRRQEVVRTFKRRDLAEEFVRRWKTARSFESVGLASPLPPSDSIYTVAQGGAPTLDSVMNRYLAEIRNAGRSEIHAATVLKSKRLLVRALGEDCPAPLTRADAVRFMAWARANTRTKGDAIRKAFVYLKTAHRVAGLEPPETPEVHVERRGRRVLDDAATAKLLAELPTGSVERTFAEIMLRTACRDAEAKRLRVKDVDIEAGVLVFETRKGPRAERVQSQRVPILPGLRAVLDAYAPRIAGRGPEASYLHDRGRPLGQWTLRRRLELASRRAGITPPVVGLGWLRNKALTLLGEAGVRSEAVARIAGHASVTTTERHYDGARLWKEREAGLAALDAALASPQFPHGQTENERNPIAPIDTAPGDSPQSGERPGT